MVAMDDVTTVGSVDSVLGVYDRLATALEHAASTASRPSSRFRRATPLMICYLARPRGAAVVCGNVQALGGLIGCNDKEFENFLVDELASYDPLLGAIRDPALPAALALYFSRACVLPRPCF